MILLTLDPGVG